MRNYGNFTTSPEWRALRKRVIKKYGRRCMRCSKVCYGRNLHVDHIKPRSKRPDLALEFDNLQILCKWCNRNKSDKHATDYRPRGTNATNSKQK